eukprot:15473321-Alexandrium_andersonii.AAC.1
MRAQLRTIPWPTPRRGPIPYPRGRPREPKQKPRGQVQLWAPKASFEARAAVKAQRQRGSAALSSFRRLWPALSSF